MSNISRPVSNYGSRKSLMGASKVILPEPTEDLEEYVDILLEH